MSMQIEELLSRTSARHGHLCPKQVLGVRIALAGMSMLKWWSPVTKDDGLIILETDGCFADGIEVATGASIGHRTLRVNDLGKIAATFADAQSGRSVRVSPRHDVRARAWEYAPKASSSYGAQLEGYEYMPEPFLLRFQGVDLSPSLKTLVSSAGARVVCQECGDEIGNQREHIVNGVALCVHCAGLGYYSESSEAAEPLETEQFVFDGR